MPRPAHLKQALPAALLTYYVLGVRYLATILTISSKLQRPTGGFAVADQPLETYSIGNLIECFFVFVQMKQRLDYGMNGGESLTPLLV